MRYILRVCSNCTQRKACCEATERGDMRVEHHKWLQILKGLSSNEGRNNFHN